MFFLDQNSCTRVTRALNQKQKQTTQQQWRLVWEHFQHLPVRTQLWSESPLNPRYLVLLIGHVLNEPQWNTNHLHPFAILRYQVTWQFTKHQLKISTLPHQANESSWSNLPKVTKNFPPASLPQPFWKFPCFAPVHGSPASLQDDPLNSPIRLFNNTKLRSKLVIKSCLRDVYITTAARAFMLKSQFQDRFEFQDSQMWWSPHVGVNI